MEFPYFHWEFHILNLLQSSGQVIKSNLLVSLSLRGILYSKNLIHDFILSKLVFSNNINSKIVLLRFHAY